MSQGSGIRRGYIDIDGLQIHFREAGTDAKPTLLLLHQSPSSSQMYEKLMAELADDFHLLAPDTPGFGNSDALALERAPTVGDYAAVIKKFLQQNMIEPCFVFGHHTGASVAVQLEYDFPGTALAMSLSGPPLLTEEQKMNLPRMAQGFPLAEHGSHLLGMWRRMRAKEPQAELALSLRETVLGLLAGDNYQQAYSAVAEQDFAAQLAALDCPVQVFAGSDDSLAAGVKPSLALLRKGVEAHLPGGERTYVCDRFPAAVANVIRPFFQAQSSDEPGIM